MIKNNKFVSALIATQPFFLGERNLDERKKSVSALIATILLIVVAVALIAIILTWGKSFTTTNLNKTNNLLNAPASDAQYYLVIENGLNGRFLAKYHPPSNYSNQSIRITRYRLFDSTNIMNFSSPIDINAGDTQALDMGIITTPFDIVLYLDDNTIITKQNITTTNLSPRISDCPTGYTPVPGNHMYGTVESEKGGFCVMKYEAKYDENGDGIGDYNDTCVIADGFNYFGPGANCAEFDNNKIVSSADGAPIVLYNLAVRDIEGIVYLPNLCSSLGGHVMTNDEYMTIARNIEVEPTNWTGNIVGTGAIKPGNISSQAEYGPDNTRDDTSKLQLSNGAYIWDFVGNTSEYVNLFLLANQVPISINNTEEVIELNQIADYKGLSYNEVAPTNPDWNSDNGVGVYYSCPSGACAYEDDNAPMVRGMGVWENYGGLYSFFFEGGPAGYNDSGFRCIVIP